MSAVSGSAQQIAQTLGMPKGGPATSYEDKMTPAGYWPAQQSLTSGGYHLSLRCTQRASPCVQVAAAAWDRACLHAAMPGWWSQAAWPPRLLASQDWLAGLPWQQMLCELGVARQLMNRCRTAGMLHGSRVMYAKAMQGPIQTASQNHSQQLLPWPACCSWWVC